MVLCRGLRKYSSYRLLFEFAEKLRHQRLESSKAITVSSHIVVCLQLGILFKIMNLSFLYTIAQAQTHSTVVKGNTGRRDAIRQHDKLHQIILNLSYV